MADRPTDFQPELTYDDRFVEQYVGSKLVSDPITAIVELVANCWDAGATKVEINWPGNFGEPLSIADNGEGMTLEEFSSRWGRLSYNRTKTQPKTVDVLIDGVVQKRNVFGRNGIGRFAAFCFGNEYLITTRKNGREVSFSVKKGLTRVLDFDLRKNEPTAERGTTLLIERTISVMVSDATLRPELGRRFLIDPAFEVSVNGVRIDFDDIEDKGLEILKVDVPSLQQEIIVKVIDAQRTDATAKQHGVAWHVRRRLVGECAWKPGAKVFDRWSARRSEALHFHRGSRCAS